MRWFLRESTVGREPLPVAMSGIGRGERVVQVGEDEPSHAAAIAARTGLTGLAVVVARDEAGAQRAHRAAANAGTLVHVVVHASRSLPFADGSFDAAIVHNRGGWLATGDSDTDHRISAESLRVLRTGGRALVIETGTPSGVLRRLRSGGTVGTGERTEAILEAGGFRAVRILADRDGYRFVEGVKA